MHRILIKITEKIVKINKFVDNAEDHMLKCMTFHVTVARRGQTVDEETSTWSDRAKIPADSKVLIVLIFSKLSGPKRHSPSFALEANFDFFKRISEGGTGPEQSKRGIKWSPRRVIFRPDSVRNS